MTSEEYSPQKFAAAGGFRHEESTIHLPAVIVDLGKFTIGRGVRIDAFCYLLGGMGVALGDRVHLASGVSIGGGGRTSLGFCVGLASGVRIVTGSDDPSSGLAGAGIPAEFRHVRRSEIVIEDFCVIFTNAVVLPGVRIGRGAIVAAGSIINRSLEPWGVYAGQPARRIGWRNSECVENDARIMKGKYGF